MAGFSTLPHELVLKVLDHVLPADFESFCAVSQYMLDLTRPALEEHRKLKKKYTIIKLEPDNSANGRNDLADLIFVLLQTPRIALYVLKVHLFNWESRWQRRHAIPQDPSKYHLFYSVEVLSTLEKATQEIDVMPRDIIDEWLTAIREGHEGPLVALLLLLLPNLQDLTLWPYPGVPYHHLCSMVQSLGKAQNHQYLANLKTVSLDYSDRWPDLNHEDPARTLPLPQAFMSLPSLVSIHAHGLCMADGEVEIEDVEHSLNSNLAEMSFSAGYIGTVILSNMIRKTNNLKSLMWESGPYEEPGPFDCSVLGEALSASARHTLETLKIHANGAEISGTLLLGEFKALRELELDGAGTLPLGGLQDLHELEMGGAVAPKCNESDLSTLPNQLPSSLEKLSLTFDYLEFGFPDEEQEGDQQVEDQRHKPWLSDQFTRKLVRKMVGIIKSLMRVKRERFPNWQELRLLGRDNDIARLIDEEVSFAVSCSGVACFFEAQDSSGNIDASCSECEHCRATVEAFFAPAT